MRDEALSYFTTRNLCDAAARSSRSLRSRALRVSEAARSNSARASSKRPSLTRRSPRTEGQQMVAPEQGLRGERVDERQPFRRAEGHRHRDRAVQLDDGGGRDVGERIVERRDARPVGLRRGARARVTGGDCGLERVRPEPAAELLGALERGQTAAHEQVIPARAVLIEEQDRLSRRADPRTRARGLDLHERDQAVDLGLLRHELGENAAETQRLVAESGPHPVLARGRRVAFVEDEVDDLEHRRETRGKLVLARYLERDSRLGERALGADDALGDRRLRDEEGARDLVGREAAEQAPSEGGARLGREHRMAGDEHEAQLVVADVVVHALDQGGFEIRRRYLLLELHLAGQLFVLALEELVAAEVIERSVLRRRHKPGARVVRNPRPGPGFERGDESLLGGRLAAPERAHIPALAA